MRYFLSREAVLKSLEKPSVYHIKKDDLYELDRNSFEFLNNCANETGCKNEDTEFTDYCLKEGILNRNKVLVKRPGIKKSPEPSLRYLELQITNKCNLKCKHCYIVNKGVSELSINQIKSVLKEFEEMQGLRLLITGGEPLIHSRFKAINEILPEFFVRKVLFTNGLLLGKKVLKKLNVDEIQISIDGLMKAHDSLRGKGTFGLAIKAVERAIDYGFEVSVSTMIHAKNLEDFDEMDELFKVIGIKDWTVDVPCITGRLEKNIEFQIGPEQCGEYLRYGYGNGLHTGASGFACGLHLMSVMADGRVSKCTFYSDDPVGRIEDGLEKSWLRIKHVRLDDLKCDCEYVELCRGGCRYRAQLLGDKYGKDLYRCKFYGIIKNSK